MIFAPKQDKFFNLLHSFGLNLEEAGKFLVSYKLKDVSDLKEYSSKLKEYEHKGDTIVHTIIAELNKTFITPIEREDILQLAMTMDDVLDGIEHYAARLEMYSITEVDDFMDQFTTNICEATKEILAAVKLISQRKLGDLRPIAIRIKDYESKCDEVLRVSIKHLFSKETDLIKIIQYKEIYELLESIADDCQDVANTLESIVMRNA
jgi:predicted phosphate transport protein (TIGR00153 family)